MRWLPALLLMSCATLPLRPADPDLPLLAPGDAMFCGTLHQRVTAEHGDTPMSAEVAIEVSRAAVHVVAFSPLGTRMLTLTWDGQHLSQELAPGVPKAFPTQRMLRDLQLAFWDEDALRRALPSGWTLVSTPTGRRIQQEGQDIILIHFGENRFQSPVELEHRTLHYRLHIEQVSVDHVGRCPS